MADSEVSSRDSIHNSAATSIESEGNTSHRLSSTLLNEINYVSWSRAVILALGGKSRLSFVDGSGRVPVPLSDGYEAWFSKDRLVMTWLLNSMEPHISEIFSFSDTAHDLWTSVKEMYGHQNNAARVFQLKKDIAELQQEGKSFVKHLGAFTKVCNELNQYRPHTTDAAVLLKRAEEDKIF